MKKKNLYKIFRFKTIDSCYLLKNNKKMIEKYKIQVLLNK